MESENQSSKLVVLIGSTGNGKSTLASFLYDPINYDTQPKFKRATSNKPETQTCSSSSCEFAHQQFDILDTPGLNESGEKDQKHMVELFRFVQEKGQISAIIICHKMHNKIDEQFQKTVAFYTDLFRSCADRNLFVVMTDVATDQRSIKLRVRDNVSVIDNANNIALEIQKIAKLKYIPSITCIDANVLKTEEAEYQAAMQSRSIIFDTIIQMPAVVTSDMLFRKTSQMEAQDELKITEKKGAIDGYQVSLVQNQNLSQQIVDKISAIRTKIEPLQPKYQQVRSELVEKSSGKEEQQKTWNANRTWTLTWHTAQFRLESDIYISNVLMTKPDTFKWCNYCKEDFVVSGELVGDWFAGVQANVITYSRKCDIYQSEIPGLTKIETELWTQISMLQDQLKDLQEDHSKYKEVMTQLLQFISTNEQEIAKLTPKFISINEAYERLKSNL